MLRLLSILLLTIAFSMPAKAQSDDIQSVINSQIEAFQNNNLDRAFSFASPAIKSMFGNPERFGVMVQRGYPMVWRPSDVRFGPLKSTGGRNVQIVFFTDQAGRVFEASYEMIQSDQGWQINGVSLKEVGLGA